MRRFLYLLLLLPLSAIPARAQLANAQGWCEQGATVVTTSGLQSSNTVQGSFPACTIQVSIHGGGLATIFSTGTSVPLSNPFTAQSNGRWLFYAANGEYDILMTGGGLTTPVLYSDVFILTSSGGGGGGGSPPGGVLGNVQLNGGPTTFTGAAGLNSEDGNNLRIKGPDPLVDVTSPPFNVRSFTGGIPQTTATCQSGSANITLASNSTPFGILNGDGISIEQCGATNTMSTPSAPTVTPATSAGETTAGFYANIPAGVAGSTTACYKVVAMDLHHGMTAASPNTCTTTGQATLGLQTVNISTITRSNDVLTVTTTGNNLVGQGTPANSGTMVHVFVATGNQMNGWYVVCSVTNATTFTLCNTVIDTRSQGSFSGDTYNQTTGTVSYFVENHISISVVTGAWEYLIYESATAGGTYTLLGATHPQGISNGYVDLNFADYGSPFLAGQTFPSYFPATAPSAPTNDMLTSTVLSGGGTTNIVLANNAGQNTSGQFATYDAAPGIIAAANFAGAPYNGALSAGYVYIPGNSAISPGAGIGLRYPIYSPLLLPNRTSVVQTGLLTVYEPIILQGSTTWTGKLAGGFGTDQFGWGSWAGIGVQTSTQPVFYLQNGGNHLDHLSINDNLTNGGHDMLIDNADETTLEYVSFGSASASTDYLSIPLIIRDTTQTITSVYLDHVSFNGGPDQITDKSWTPMLWEAPGESSSGASGLVNIYLKANNLKFNRRGIYVSNCFPVIGCSNGPSFTDIDWLYRQGGITPVFGAQLGNTNSVTNLHNTSVDTENNPIFACLNSNSFCGTLDISMTTGGNTSTLTEGGRSSSVRISLFGPSGSQYQSALQNRDSNHQGIARAVTSPFATSGSYLPVNVDLFTFFEPVHITGGQSLYFDMALPTNVAGAVAAGGSVPVASPIYYAVSAVGADSGETILSIPSAAITTTGGNQTVNLTWSASTGAVSYNVWRCTIGASCLFNGVINTGAITGGVSAWQRMVLHNVGTSYSDTSATGTIIQPPFVTGTGSTVLNSSGITTTNLTVNGSCTGCGGGGGIGGSIANNQIAAGSGANTIHGFAGFTFDGTTHKLPNASFTETTAPSAAAGQDILYGDSATHTLQLSVNNGAFQILPPISGATTGGDCVQFGTGPTLVDSGAGCGGGSGGLNVAMSNAAGVALNASIIPGAVNTVALGSNPLSFTNLFLGTVANQSGSFDTSALTANHVIKFPNASSTAVQNCPTVSHEWISQILQSTGACTLTQPAITDISGYTLSGNTTEFATVTGAVTATHAAVWDASGNLLDGGTTVTSSSTNTFTNKTLNAESTGNALSEPIKAFFAAAGCNNSTAGPAFDLGVTNAPTPQCAGTTVRKGVLQFARGNVAYINWHLPPDWNSSAATDIELGFTTTDTTNGHITSFNIQTGCNIVNGTATDDPSLNALQALSVTTGASQISGGMLTGTKTALTMTGCVADYNFEIAITRNNSGTDTNTDTGVAVKFAEITTGVTKNASNR